MVYSHITWRSIQWNQRIKSLKWKKCVLFRFHSATLLVTQWEGLKPSWIRRESWVSLRNNKTPFYCLRINDKSNLPPPFFLINALLLSPHPFNPWSHGRMQSTLFQIKHASQDNIQRWVIKQGPQFDTSIISDSQGLFWLDEPGKKMKVDEKESMGLDSSWSVYSPWGFSDRSKEKRSMVHLYWFTKGEDEQRISL